MGGGEHIAIAVRFRADEARQTRLPLFWSWLVPAALLLFWLVLLCGDDGLLYGGLLLGGVMALIAGSRALAMLAGVLRVAPRSGGVALADDDADLPPYTVMVPLYREVEVLDHLLAAMAALRYPRSRLQVLLLVEEDDGPTRQALAGRSLPQSVRMVVVPRGAPRTKPRACNYALDRFVGDDGGLAVIFDAEDRPEPDQLLRAAAAFRQLPPSVACLQARLAADSRARGVVGLLWGLEYAAWFGLYLPGLYALGAPVPLGGTSNHFRAHILRRLRWDAWNVTEDAELGIRLARAGLRTGVLDSTTWEDAPGRWGVWLRQRTRWLKGWWVTAATHLGDRGSLRDLGLWRWLWMVHLTLGTVMSHLLLPLALLFAGTWLYDRWPLADAARPWTWAGPLLASGLVLLHLFFLSAHALAAWLQRGNRLLAALPLLPVAWVMAAVAGWRAYWQALGMPYFWEKTPHGAAVVAASPVAGAAAGTAGAGAVGEVAATFAPAASEPRHRAGARGRMVAGLALLLVMGVVVLGAYRAAGIGGLVRQGELLKHEQRRTAFVDLAAASFAPEADWSAAGNGHLEVVVSVTNTAALGYDLVVWLKLWDGAWFERTVKVAGSGAPQRLAVPFDDGWRSDNPALRFAPAWLLRVREAGVRLRGLPQDACGVRLLAMRAVAGAEAPLQAAAVAAPAQVAVNDVWELRFDVSRQRGNPFAVEEVDLRCVAEGPDGERVEVPCFFTLDHRLVMDEAGVDQVSPFGAPRWGARLSPERPGAWQVRVEGHDAAGALQPFAVAFVAEASELSGTVRASGAWFRRDGGFFYPVTLNLRSPHDELVAQVMPQIRQPRPEAGTGALIPWLEQCADNGFNWLRLWTMPSSLGLEWSAGWNGYHGCNRYNLANASRIDELLRVARRRRITLELAIWQHGPWQREVDAQWADNPWNSDNGGPLDEPTEVLRDARARAGQRNLLRYVAARWGADAALAAWTLWIEVDGVVAQDMAAWHKEMADELRRHDSRGHLISTEFRSALGDAATFSLPEIDFTQVAAYDVGGLVNTFRQRAASFTRYGKPLLIEEYGGHSTGGSLPWLAQQIHDGPWIAWMLDIAAAPMPWWWSFIFEQRLERHFARFAEFIRGEDLAAGAWRLASGGVEGAPGLDALWRVGGGRAYGWVYRGDLADMKAHRRGGLGWWAYAGRVSREFEARRDDWSPLAAKPGAQFNYGAASLDLAALGLSPGEWRYELWDTWEATPPQSGTVAIKAGEGALPLPPITRDFAIKLWRQADGAQQ